MQAEIMMIGTELLLGQINDTNATYMAQKLAENGINLFQKTTVGDNRERICDALNQALERSDVILCSGGLGPTEDDITRECVAEVFDRPLEYDEEIFAVIEAMFARYRIPITENNKKQAMVPKGALIIENPNGTAPGLYVEDDRGIIVCMPGVPRELYDMLDVKVIPHLREHFGLKQLIHYRVLKVCGVGESTVDDTMGDLILSQKNPTVGVLANPAWVRIRIAAQAESIEEANKLIDPVDEEVRKRFPGLVMGVDDDTLEGVVDGLLADKGWTLALAETTSGGMMAQRLIAQRSVQFVGGRVYRSESLNLEDAELAAMDLAKKCREEFDASCALASVPDATASGTAIAFIHPKGAEQWRFGRADTDERMQLRTCVVALENVRRLLANEL